MIESYGSPAILLESYISWKKHLLRYVEFLVGNHMYIYIYIYTHLYKFIVKSYENLSVTDGAG